MAAAPRPAPRLSPCVNADGRAKFKWTSRSVAKRVARQTPVKDGMRARVYRCFACSGYHVGHWRVNGA